MSATALDPLVTERPAAVRLRDVGKTFRQRRRETPALPAAGS